MTIKRTVVSDNKTGNPTVNCLKKFMQELDSIEYPGTCVIDVRPIDSPHNPVGYYLEAKE